jgi:hypothetical protein
MIRYFSFLSRLAPKLYQIIVLHVKQKSQNKKHNIANFVEVELVRDACTSKETS